MKELKIKNHQDYLLLLKKLEPRTKYLELVQPDGEIGTHLLVNQFNKDIISQKEVSHWRETSSKGVMRKFDVNLKNKGQIFKVLAQFSSFFFNQEDATTGIQTVTWTDFGLDDIFFTDNQGQLLAYTITHEGICMIQESLEI